MSDLEKRIEQWREDLRASGAFGTADIEKLKAHLRKEMARLEPLGLSVMEAFLVSCLAPYAAHPCSCLMPRDRGDRLRLSGFGVCGP